MRPAEAGLAQWVSYVGLLDRGAQRSAVSGTFMVEPRMGYFSYTTIQHQPCSIAALSWVTCELF